MTDVIVIGGGIHGCSTALFCARRGLTAVVLEKDHVARHASGVNAGGVRQLSRHVAEIPLSIASMAIWHMIGELVDDDCGFDSHGQVLIAENRAEFEACRARVDDLRARGFTHEELIDAAELHRLVPAAAPTGQGGVVSRRDGAADPFRTTQAISRKARSLGVAFHEKTRVAAMKRADGVWSVTSDDGRVWQAPMVVNAAGAWADRIAAMAGEAVPLEAVALMLMITSRLRHFLDPVVILRGRKLSFKQFANGTVMIGGGYRGRAHRDTNRTTLDWRLLATSAQTVVDLFPVMQEATVIRAWAGIEAVTPDGLPVLGQSRRAEGLIHQFGFSAHGFQLGPGTGAMIAELIATGATALSLDAFSISRFG
jgi:sarcosine oxidase subunit beta